MRRDLIGAIRPAILFAGLAMASASAAQAVTVYDNGLPQPGGNAHEISTFVSANDFVLTEETAVLSLTFWASVEGNTNFATSFNGTIGWAIFNDNGLLPGTLLFSGQDSTITTTPTGLVNIAGGEVVQVDADFTPNLTLGAGTYWLALREGDWGAAGDSSEIFWQRTTTLLADPIRIDPNETNPVNWLLFSAFDGAFKLEGRATSSGDPGDAGDPGESGEPGDPRDPGDSGEPVGGADVPEPASMLMGLVGAAALGVRRRK